MPLRAWLVFQKTLIGLWKASRNWKFWLLLPDTGQQRSQSAAKCVSGPALEWHQRGHGSGHQSHHRDDMRWHRYHFRTGRTVLCGGHRLAESKHSNDFLCTYLKRLIYDAFSRRQTISRMVFFMQLNFLFHGGSSLLPFSIEMRRVPCIRHTDFRPHGTARHAGE